MSKHLDNIRVVLEREIPEIRTGDSVGLLFGLFLSMGMLISLGVLLAFVVVPSPGAVPLIGFPVLVLGLSYLTGAAMDGSTEMVGADIANASVEDYNSSWTGYSRDRAAHGIQLGLALMALQVLAGAMYGTIKHYRERDVLPADDKRSQIAASFVNKLLKGPSKQDVLFKLPSVKDFSLEEKRAALTALTSNNFVESLPTGLQLGRGIREKF